MSETISEARGGNVLQKALHNKRVLNVISIVLFLGIWDLIVVVGNATMMPRPWEVVTELIDMFQSRLAGYTLHYHTWISFRRVMIAFLLAAVIGIPLGVQLLMNKTANAIVGPIFEFFKQMPWFGIGVASKIFIMFIGALVPLILNSYNGIRLVDPELYDCIRNLGATYWQEHLQVTAPSCIPAIFAGLQIALSTSWTCVVAAELVGARSGLGFVINQGMRIDNTAMCIAGMLVICLVSFLTSFALTLIERGLCPWTRNTQI